MEGHPGRKQTEHQQKEAQQVKRALNDVAATKSGRIFLRWLSNRCFFSRSTLTGNIQTHEINQLGSLAQAYVQRLYFDIRRDIRPALRKRIEYPNQDEE